MTTNINELHQKIDSRFSSLIDRIFLQFNEITLEVPARHLREICFALRDEPAFDFKMLIDVCGVDYLQYGITEWETTSATLTGFERGVEEFTEKESVIASPELFAGRGNPEESESRSPRPNASQPRDDSISGFPFPGRFASVYHLLSLKNNQRLRIRVFLKDELRVPSVTDIWPAANWFERESYDLFGIFYENHPDLRRILTDYGFIGHPFRKDFPLIGKVEARYDAKAGRVIYEPVSIKPRILEPKVIRDDNRYEKEGQ